MRYLFIGVLFLLSCESENGVSYFIFGDYYGECFGDCARFYKYENDELFPDESYENHYTGEELIFSPQNTGTIEQLSDAKSLSESIPNYMNSRVGESFGCPDCGDWGGIYVEIKSGEDVRSWVLDNRINGNPEEIQDFALQIQKLLIELNN